LTVKTTTTLHSKSVPQSTIEFIFPSTMIHKCYFFYKKKADSLQNERKITDSKKFREKLEGKEGTCNETTSSTLEVFSHDFSHTSLGASAYEISINISRPSSSTLDPVPPSSHPCLFRHGIPLFLWSCPHMGNFDFYRENSYLTAMSEVKKY